MTGPLIGPSDDERRAIREITEAVIEGELWRIGLLLERFALGATLPALMALKVALSETAARRDRQ